MRYSIVALAVASTSVYAQTTCSPIPGTIVQPSGAPQITACANSLKLGDPCGSDQQCPAGVECFGSTAGTIRTCGSFNAVCTNDSQCATNTCNNGLCNGLKPSPSSSSSSAAPTSTSTTCAAPGAYDAQGRYSCNPAHSYPAGQTCTFINGCPLLVNATASSSSTSAPTSSPTSTCPAAGSSDSQGRYSCNPAHAYPTGQKCQLVDGCYFLASATSTSTSTSTSSTTMAPSYGGGNTTATAGSTGSAGSPAAPKSSVTPYTGGASVTGALSGVAAIAVGIVAFVM
ncbi:uncharacterized protein MYCFIDRAFT_210849 [Pseudocercospora fijiensis CIRAD86]|uniref:Uncharacterized protein n=1 Tax=Pseudocercospora fijiensis (strain CIRAD86) TaxID=383855 RepID=M3B4Q0_PSEFD|nr:uncharacterized protein MYCFIDRAFT_210849 [Pseudocercospora fijiensis CIRAD86]EME84327.1 hypothetical protein MYCFIDRAFT_210849 [Pseudocercospora fijiensis CIRAD86]